MTRKTNTARENPNSELAAKNPFVELTKITAPSRMGSWNKTAILVPRPRAIKIPPKICAKAMKCTKLNVARFASLFLISSNKASESLV